MQSRNIILLCVASAILYGICHDQVTARVCVEYFTVGHAPLFHFGAVVLTMLLGLILAWKWEAVGGLLILGGLVLFATAKEPVLLNIVFTPWLVTGLLYLVCWAGKHGVGRMVSVHRMAAEK